MTSKIPELTINLKEVIIKSECKTCNAAPLISKEWYEGHWGCIECGDPNSKTKENQREMKIMKLIRFLGLLILIMLLPVLIILSPIATLYERS